MSTMKVFSSHQILLNETILHNRKKYYRKIQSYQILLNETILHNRGQAINLLYIACSSDFGKCCPN